MNIDIYQNLLVEWLNAGLRKEGKTNTALASALGIPQPRIAEMKAGKRRIKASEIGRIADYLGEPIPPELSGPDLVTAVPIVGFVGAGAAIYPIDAYAKGDGVQHVPLETAHIQPGMVGVVVRGDSMSPALEDGDCLFYSRQLSGADLIDLLGRLCVVCLDDGRMYVKKLQRSSGTFWLHSFNGEPILAPDIVWAAKVEVVKKA
jgi:SOS-response transcriptional repressor LexA